MLHILWLVIKCIGILLAVLLAVSLLALVSILFCPVRYRVKIQKTLEEWGAQGRVSWLFGLLSVTVRGGSAKMDVDIRILGIKLSFLKRVFSRKKKTAKKGLDTQDTLPAIDVSAIEKDGSRDGVLEDDIPGDSIRGGDISGGDIPEDGIRGDGAQKDSIQGERIQEDLETEKEGLCRRLWMKILEKCRSIRDAFGKFVAVLQNMRDTTSLWKGFLVDPHTGAAVGLAWRQGCRLLRHVGPQKWEGAVYFGLDDPAATGQVLAILGATYPIYRGQLSVVPVWDRKVLEGKACVKGRVYGIMVLCMAVRIYFDKNVRYVIQWFRKNGGNYGTGK